MSKKSLIVVLIILILIAIGVATYFIFFNQSKLSSNLDNLETIETDMPFASQIPDLKLDDFNIQGTVLPSDLFSNIEVE
ncbi:MAG: hypothetical protein PHS07_03290 [Patescibacteria group bacterium]|nr:hypothetical protein [Patescibacteria group bacterium]